MKCRLHARRLTLSDTTFVSFGHRLIGSSEWRFQHGGVAVACEAVRYGS